MPPPMPPPTFVASEEPAVTVRDGVVTCGDLRVELPAGLAVVKTTPDTVLATGSDAALEVSLRSTTDLVSTWLSLHEQVTGERINDVAVTAHWQSGGGLVADYAVDRGASHFQYAYRGTAACVIGAVERTGSTSGAVAMVTSLPAQPLASPGKETDLSDELLVALIRATAGPAQP